ncbi:MAG: alanine racemase, partial [Terriglobales bacterium]
PAGQAVGYGGLYTTRASARLAVVGAGYADGYRRDFSPGARVALGQGTAPVVGAISMDLTTVDVTGLAAALGDEVALLGCGITAVELATQAGTIPYEILCGLSARVERRYVD